MGSYWILILKSILVEQKFIKIWSLQVKDTIKICDKENTRMVAGIVTIQ